MKIECRHRHRSFHLGVCKLIKKKKKMLKSSRETFVFRANYETVLKKMTAEGKI